MTILVTIQAQLITGEEQVIKSLAPEGMLAAVFEDDGQTGYFYALDESVEGNPIQDAITLVIHYLCLRLVPRRGIKIVSM